MKLSEEREFVNCVWYGDPGTWKTTCMASLANLGEIVYVDAEAGLKASALSRREIPLEDIDVHREISYSALDALFWELKDDPPFGCIWDSVTETQKLLLEQVVAVQVEKAQKVGKVRADTDVFREDWGTNTEQMRRLVRRFRDLPCHVGWAALERRDQDDDGTVRYGPAVTPALQNDLMGYADLVCHTFTMPRIGSDPDSGEEEGFGHFRSAGKYQAKDRFGALPPILVNPTFDRVVAYVEGTLTVESDPVQQEARERKAKAEKDAKKAAAA